MVVSPEEVGQPSQSYLQLISGLEANIDAALAAHDWDISVIFDWYPPSPPLQQRAFVELANKYRTAGWDAVYVSDHALGEFLRFTL